MDIGQGWHDQLQKKILSANNLSIFDTEAISFTLLKRIALKIIIVILYTSNLDIAAVYSSVFFRQLLGAELVVLDHFLQNVNFV